MTQRTAWLGFNIGIASLALMLAYGLEKSWPGLLVTLGLGLGGWLGKKSERGADLFFAGIVLLTTIGVFLNLATSLLLTAVLGGLGAWDLIRFQKRIAHSPRSESIAQIEKHHLTLLGVTLLSGGIAVAFLLTARVQLSFSLTLFLSVALIIILGQAYRLLRN